MIVHATENTQKFEQIIKDSGFLGQKIYADYISGQIKETNSFYVSENCAFMLSGVNLTLCGKPAADELEELLTFCNFCGVSSIESQIKNLPMSVDKKLHIMEYVGETTVEREDVVSNILSAIKNKNITDEIKNNISLFGILPEELTEIGATLEEIKVFKKFII